MQTLTYDGTFQHHISICVSNHLLRVGPKVIELGLFIFRPFCSRLYSTHFHRSNQLTDLSFTTTSHSSLTTVRLVLMGNMSIKSHCLHLCVYCKIHCTIKP